MNEIKVQITRPKILLLQSYFQPEKIASTHLFDDLFASLVHSGYLLEVYAPYPTRGITKEERKACIKDRKDESLYDGQMAVHRFPLFREGKHSLPRAFRYLLCILMQTYYGLKAKNCDVLFLASTPPINGLMMAVLHKFKKYKIVYNLQDIFPDSLVHTGMTRHGSLLWKIGRWVENVTYRAADKIIVISEGFKQNIMAKGVPEEKIAVIPNWVDENQVTPIDRTENPLFEKYGLDRGKFYICYSGNIGHTQNMEMLTETAKLLEDHENIGFVMIGDGAFKPKLEEIIAQKGLKNITLLPFQDYAAISQVFSLGDVGLIISKKGVGTNSVPSKTWSIMSAGRPVLASFDEDSELCRIITETGCGICIPPDDAAALTTAIKDMYNNRAGLAAMGKQGRDYILRHLTKKIGTQQYVDVLKIYM